MPGMSKEEVMRRIGEPPERPVGVEGKPSMTARLRGMLNPKGPVGRAALRPEYQKYVEEQLSRGREPLSYEDWAEGRK